MEIRTSYARSVLPEMIPLKDAAGNWANTAALVAAVARGNVADFGRAVVDRVVEPVRAKLIPGFADVKKAALETGAHGCSISGAGPALFAVATAETAERVALAMQAAFQRHGLPSRHFVCPPDNRGARRLD